MTDFSRFGSSTNADEVVADQDLSARVMIVTGANTGIGFETARALASAGARVILGCRDAERGRLAEERIRERHPKAEVESRVLDLGSFASIRAFAKGFDPPTLDVLVCNAGVSKASYNATAEGFEATVGICHIGHFLLTQELLPKLLADGTGRVVMVSSESHRSPKTLAFDRLPLSRDGFSPMVSYGQAKLCNVLFANELQRRYGDQGLTACSLHPGTLITTEIGRDWIVAKLAILLASPFTKSPNQGAATTVVCATDPDAARLAGRYFSNCQTKQSSVEANDLEVAERLWTQSEQWIDRESIDSR